MSNNRTTQKIDSILSFKSNKSNIAFRLKGENIVTVNFGDETKDVNLNTEEFTLVEHTYGNSNTNNITISGANNITEVDISSNEITEVEISNCSNLQKLFIYNNNINSLNLSELSNLQYIHMQNNPICKNKELMTQMISTLPDRNNKAFGSIVMYDFVPPRNFESMTEEQRSIRELRKELEKTSIPKDWYFGSAIMYDEVEKNKVPNTVTMSNVVDIWESAEYGEGAVYASLYEVYIPDTTSEWDKDVFLGKYDITSEGEVIESTQTDSNTTSYDTGHGASTNSILISQGNEMYGLIPKSKCISIFRGNTTNIDILRKKYFSKNIFNKLTELDKLDFVFTSTTYWTTEEFPEYSKSIKECLDKHKTLFFICSSNKGDDDISTPDDHIQTYHSHIVSGCNLDIDNDNMSSYVTVSSNDNDDRIKFTANYFGINYLVKNKGINSGGLGSSYSTPYMAGVFCLLKILYDKKYSDYSLEQLEQYTYNHAKPLHYTEDAVTGYGTLNCMYYEDKSTLVKATSLTKNANAIDLSKDNKIESIINILPDTTSNKDFRLANKLDDRDIIIDKGIIYPQKNNGEVVTKKLYSSSNLKLSETVDITLPKNKKYEEIKNGLIFSLSVENEFVDGVSGQKLIKNGNVNIVQNHFKFGQDGVLKLNNFKIPDVLTIQYLVDKETDLQKSKIEYPVYLLNSANDKIKMVCGVRHTDTGSIMSIYQFGTPTGNAFSNIGSFIKGEYNEPFNCLTITIDFKTGRILLYRNGISIIGAQESNIPCLLSSSGTTKQCYLDNLRNLLTMDTLIIGNNASLQKGAETLDIYDIRIFDRELTPTEVVQNTSALMCNAQYIKEEGGTDMGFADKKGITVTAGFKLQADALIDARGCVENQAEREELVTLKAAAAGLRVFQKDNKTSYVYTGTEWQELSKGSAYQHPSTHPATMITEDATHRFVTDTEKATWNAKADKTLASADNNGLMSSAHFSKIEALDANLAKKVDKTTTINGKPLSANVTLVAEDVQAIPTSEKGAANGVAELGEDGKILAAQLPSYVDDVIEGYLHTDGKFYKEEGHTTPITGESAKIYIDLTGGKNVTYRWSGTVYSPVGSSLALGETESTAYRGDRGKIAYDHSQAAHARVDATKTEKSNTNGNVKINGVETQVYAHPANHAATMITEDTTHRFVSDAEKTKWNAKANIIWAEDGQLPAKAPVGALVFQAVKKESLT